MKKFLTIFLAVFMLFSIGTTAVACKNNTGDDTSQTQELTDEEKVRNAVITKAIFQYFGRTIGGNEIKDSSATITNLLWLDKNTCKVSGVMKMKDVYGTIWKNNYDCVVTTSDDGEHWKAGSFEYKSNYWSKS